LSRWLEARCQASFIPLAFTQTTEPTTWPPSSGSPDTGEVQDENLIGAFDLVVNDGRRRTIVENKTSARKYGEDQIRWDIQPTGYQFAAKQMGLGDVGVQYQVVTKTRTPALQVIDLERSAEDQEEFLRVAIGVMRAVDAGVFVPVRSWACRGCPYAHVCRPSKPEAVTTVQGCSWGRRPGLARFPLALHLPE